MVGLSSLFLFLLFFASVFSAVQNNAYFIKTNNSFVIDGNSNDWADITTTHPILDQYGNTVCKIYS